MDRLPRPVLIRVFGTWSLVVLPMALVVVAQPGRSLEDPRTAALTLASFALLVALGVRSSLYLAAARHGVIRLDGNAPAHRLWRLAPLSLAAGLVASLPGVALAAFAVSQGVTRIGLGCGLVVTTALSFFVSHRLVVRDVARPTSRRPSALLSWLLVDTALPAAIVASAVGAGVAWLRLAGEQEVSASVFSRHLAVTLFLYAATLGPAGALKTAREKLAGLVGAPTPRASLPGPILTGGVLGVLVLAVGPRVLPAMSVDHVVLWKAVLGALAGGGLCALGAWQGAGVVEHRRGAR